ncbi:cytochrome c oxidase assembly protein Cox19p [Trichomonascus vanleenenianus]|uniref:Cox19p n=1 Tax=Trichomonascus vanleenenianus TaxID=2268995 RepID=UPI003ECA6880
MSAASASGVQGSVWRPTPPLRGSFPLDHDHDCSEIMQDYLNCLKYVKGQNSHGCRLVAKNYLKCRMDNGLMDKDEWRNLGLPEDDPGIKKDK